jgi:carbonic anhydrase/acetyltransferase-like protein (isoleucine patch superfamily)
VVSAESGAVSIGANCVVMDTAVLRGVRRNPHTIGDNVLVGPRAYLTGCSIENEVFIATGATNFHAARIGRRSEVRINYLEWTAPTSVLQYGPRWPQGERLGGRFFYTMRIS